MLNLDIKKLFLFLLFWPSSMTIQSILLREDTSNKRDGVHPREWPMRKKLLISIIASYATATASFTSAIFAADITQVTKKFHFGDVVGALGTSLFVLGFATGPLLWAPLSEMFGRRIPILIGMLGCSAFTLATAVSQNVQTLMTCRFFAGLFAASLVTIVPAIYADIFETVHRSIAIAVYTCAMFIAPLTAPVVGGFVADNIGWRWTLYIPAIMGFTGLGLLIVFLEETYALIMFPDTEPRPHLTLKNATQKYFSRPLVLLFTRPIVFLISLYVSFVYALVYALLGAYPFVFRNVYHMHGGVENLPFIGLIIGQLVGLALFTFRQPNYEVKLKKNNNMSVPEWRLPRAAVGGVAFAVGLFMFGWTGFTKSVHWMVPTSSGVLNGFGMYTIFLQCFNYLIDSYPEFAASTVAGNTILRSSFGAAFPLFTSQMYQSLGVQWASTILGGIAVVMIPIPILFNMYGSSLRLRGTRPEI